VLIIVLGINGKVLLECVLGTLVGMVLIGFIWLRIGTSVRLFQTW